MIIFFPHPQLYAHTMYCMYFAIGWDKNLVWMSSGNLHFYDEKQSSFVCTVINNPGFPLTKQQKESREPGLGTTR